MPTEDWLVRFEASLRDYARALAGELKETDPAAEARGRSFEIFLGKGLFCPECWVRYGRATTMYKQRRMIGCDEHSYHVPPPAD